MSLSAWNTRPLFRPVLLVVTSALLLSGCAVPGALPASSTAPSSTPEPTTEPSASTSSAGDDDGGSTDGVDTSDWLTYTTRDEDMSYRYPSDWTLDSNAYQRDDARDGRERFSDDASLTAPNGQRLLASTDFVDIGGACTEESLRPLEVLASEAVRYDPVGDDEPVIATVALQTLNGDWRVGVGITGAEYLDDERTCGLYFVTGTSNGGVGIGTHFTVTTNADADPLWDVATLDDARAYMETDEYATILEVLRSVEPS